MSLHFYKDAALTTKYLPLSKLISICCLLWWTGIIIIIIIKIIIIIIHPHSGLQYLNETQIDSGIEKDRLQLHLRTFVQNSFQYNRQYIYEVVYHQYQDWQTERDSRSVRDFVADFLGDALHVAPTINLVRRRINNIQQHAHFMQSSGNFSFMNQVALKTKTFMYCYNFQTTPRSTKSYPKTSFHPSALPGDELVYIFGEPLIEQMENTNSRTTLYSARDQEFSEMIVIHWKNFVHSGSVLVQ